MQFEQLVLQLFRADAVLVPASHGVEVHKGPLVPPAPQPVDQRGATLRSRALTYGAFQQRHDVDHGHNSVDEPDAASPDARRSLLLTAGGHRCSERIIRKTRDMHNAYRLVP